MEKNVMALGKDTTKLFHGQSWLQSSWIYLLLLLGVVLRFIVYLQNRSLIIDEANLARNIVERDFSELFLPLAYQQYAPPFFLCLSKLMIKVFGVTEWALKAFPLVMAFLGLWLFLLLIKHFIKSNIPIAYTFLLLCFSTLAIRYSTEFKQYSSDLTIVLAFSYWAIKEKDKNWNAVRLLLWGSIGAIAIWFCMPLVFVLGAIGIAFLYTAWRNGVIERIYVCGVGALWLISFIAYFLLILRTDVQADNLQSYHQEFFFDLLPTTSEALQQNWKMLENFFRLVTDKTVLSIIWSILTIGLGCFSLWRKNRFALTILLLPILFCLLAAHLHLYSLISRLILFLIPSLMLLTGIGLDYFWNKSSIWFKIVLPIIMMISLVNKEGYQYFWKKMEFEDSKSALAVLEEKLQKEEVIYVQADAVPAFIFYNQMHKDALNFKNVRLAKWEQKPSELLLGTKNDQLGKKFWIFFSHTFPETRKQQILDAQTFAEELEVFKFKQAQLHLFEMKN